MRCNQSPERLVQTFRQAIRTVTLTTTTTSETARAARPLRPALHHQQFAAELMILMIMLFLVLVIQSSVMMHANDNRAQEKLCVPPDEPLFAPFYSLLLFSCLYEGHPCD
jgi:hypothetical protein